MAAPRNNSVFSKVSKGKPTSRVPNESFEPDLHRHIGLSVLQDVASMSLLFPVFFWCSIPRLRFPTLRANAVLSQKILQEANLHVSMSDQTGYRSKIPAFQGLSVWIPSNQVPTARQLRPALARLVATPSDCKYLVSRAQTKQVRPCVSRTSRRDIMRYDISLNMYIYIYIISIYI